MPKPDDLNLRRVAVTWFPPQDGKPGELELRGYRTLDRLCLPESLDEDQTKAVLQALADSLTSDKLSAAIRGFNLVLGMLGEAASRVVDEDGLVMVTGTDGKPVFSAKDIETLTILRGGTPQAGTTRVKAPPVTGKPAEAVKRLMASATPPAAEPGPAPVINGNEPQVVKP